MSDAFATAPLRVGIVGAGYVARGAHIPGWAAAPGAAVAAICDPDPAALEAALRAPGMPAGVRTFSDPAAMLADGVDAVSICTPNALHAPAALAALRAGVHVLCEKPLGLTAAEAAALGAEADARGLVLMAHHQLRFDGAALAARECVRSGRLGAVHHVRARALRRNRVPTVPWFLDPERAGGGAALDLGIHALDMALWLTEFPRALRVSGSTRVTFARGGRIRGHWGDWDRERVGVEDFAAGLVHFEGGLTLSLECAWIGHHAEEGPSCELLGEGGALRWPAGELVSQGAFFRREALKVPETGSPHFAAIRAFVGAVRAGGPSPVPWREACRSLGILDALYRSAREGREVEVEGRG